MLTEDVIYSAWSQLQVARLQVHATWSVAQAIERLAKAQEQANRQSIRRT